MGKPKHQAQTRKHIGYIPTLSPVLPVASIWSLPVPLDNEIIKVVGLRPDGLSVTTIRDNHQQVYDFPPTSEQE